VAAAGTAVTHVLAAPTAGSHSLAALVAARQAGRFHNSSNIGDLTLP
jgi:hypothetical protein